jgi:hypothetical protein
LRNQHIKIEGHCHFARNRGAGNDSELPSSSTRLKIEQSFLFVIPEICYRESKLKKAMAKMDSRQRHSGMTQ